MNEKHADRPTPMHAHAIVLLRNAFAPAADKLLLYEDPRWRCPLFLHYKTNQEGNRDDILITHLSEDLLIPPVAISLSFLAQAVQTKYSISAGEIRTYHHWFYLATAIPFPDHLKADTLEITGRRYRWMSIEEMELDQNIMSKNGDIVEYVKALLTELLHRYSTSPICTAPTPVP